MEDLKLEDDDNIPAVSGGEALFAMLRSRELGTLGRWPPREKRKKKPNLPSSNNQSEAPTSNSVEVSAEVAEERLIYREKMEVLPCKLNGLHTRSTFLMVFSPDKELMASTHGDHNIYISEVKTGDCVQTLKGHPRTPWCIAFHPAHNGLLASGCLGGHVKVWDLNGGSESWRTEGVVASLAFHPVERMLVIATSNEIHFWDWAEPAPYFKVSTKSDKEKVRYVKFDSVGHNLITGIANLHPSGGSGGGSSGNGNYYYHRSERLRRRNQDYAQNSSRDRPIYMGVRRIGGDPNTPPTYGRYFSVRGIPTMAPMSSTTFSNRGTNTPPSRSRNNGNSGLIVNRDVQIPMASPVPGSGGNGSASATATSASASQTLSDLAAAASSQLMAENEAAAAAAEAAAEANGLRLTSGRHHQPPDRDPLLSDHPYGRPSRRWFHNDEANGNGSGNTSEWMDMISPFDISPSDADRLLRRRRQINRYIQERRSQRRALARHQHLLNSGESETELMFANPDRNPTGSANDRFQAIRERRMLRALHDQRRRASEMEAETSRSNPANSTLNRPIDEWAINRMLLQERQSDADLLTGSAPTSTVSDRYGQRFTRMMDFLSRDNLLRDFSSSNNGNSRQSSSTSTSRGGVDNDNDSDSVTAQFGDEPEVPPVMDPIEPEVTARPTSTIDANMSVSASASSESPTPQDSPSREGENSTETPPSVTPNDHNYTLNPTDDASASPQVASQTEQQQLQQQQQQQPPEQDRTTTSGGTATTARSSSTTSEIDSHAMVLLNQHIRHMLRIFRASLADPTVTNRQRRQALRLQSIKRMLEDLQRQIRSLSATTLEENFRSVENVGSAIDALRSENNNMNIDGDSEEDEQPQSLGLEERNYDERLGEGYRMRHLARTLPRTARALGRLHSTITPSLRPSSSVSRVPLRRSVRSPPASASSTSGSTSRGNNSRLSRVHSQLVSQMRATFRAMEMSPDLNLRGKSPLGDAKTNVSQKVMEKTEKEATVIKTIPTTMTSSPAATSARKPPTASASETVKPKPTNTKGELRALSQRLEKSLREIREAEGENSAASNSHADDPRDIENDDHYGLPRPDPLPMDLRKRWRHMYDGIGDCTRSGRGGSAEHYSFFGHNLDSSESGSESDLDLRGGGGRRRSSSFHRYDSHRLSLRWNRSIPRRSPHSPRRPTLRSSGLHPYLRQRELTGASIPDLLGAGEDDVTIQPEVEAEADFDLGTERLPPLRELIWRRLRRRNAQLSRNMEALPAPTQNSLTATAASRGHREALSWMVDQMHLDQQLEQQQLQAQQASENSRRLQVNRDPHRSTEPSSTPSRSSPPIPPRVAPAPAPAPAPSPGPGPRLPPHLENHTTFRQRYVNVMSENLPPSVELRVGDHHTFNGGPSAMLLTHRIQAWDLTRAVIPEIADPTINVIVPEAKIHNDASVDIAEDGSILVTLVPSNLPMTTVVGVYSLLPDSRGRLYATCSLESSAVSVSLSPTSRHLLVGLAMRAGRISLSPSDRTLMAQVYKIKMPWECQQNNQNQNNSCTSNNNANPLDQDSWSSAARPVLRLSEARRRLHLMRHPPLVDDEQVNEQMRLQFGIQPQPPSPQQQQQQQQQHQRGRLVHRRDLHQDEQGMTSLNCIRWIPVPGQGIVYATNTGLLKILR